MTLSNIMKRSLTYLPHCLVPLLLLATLNYWNGLKSVDATLAAQAQAHLNSLAGEIDRRLHDEEIELSRATLSSQLQDLLRTKQSNTSGGLSTESNAAPGLPSELFLNLSSLLKGRAHCFRLAVFDQSRRGLFQIERQRSVQGPDSFLLRSTDLTLTPVSSGAAKKEFAHSLNGSILRYSVPISGNSANEEFGSLVADLNLEEVIEEASRVLSSRQTSNSTQRAQVTVLDPSAKIIYHTNRDLEGKVISSAQPEFLSIAEPLTKGTAGLERFRGPASEDFITAFSPLPKWDLGIAVGYNRSPLAATAHRWGIIGFVLALLGGLASALMVSPKLKRKSPGFERVEEGLTAIAKGELDRRIELKSSDDARGIADSINAMTERLREQIAREEETRQFQSFVRLSAMLTHDLKNAIEALSLIVGNMERHFDNEQFRLDALKSLTSATEKLKGIVARLTRPLSSLSGEHPRPKSVDLVPILKRVAAVTAEPMREKHALDIRLPRNLFVFTDPERIERVIENLIINALESMTDKNGSLTIEAGLTSRGAATFSISDTGSGMSQSFIDNLLFRPFSTTKKHGVGLGLYTCREVIEASAGSIEVESKPGAGTTFRVVLPSASHDSRN
jgi:signal transduction histidine kinase